MGDWLSIPTSNREEEFMWSSIVFKDREILKSKNDQYNSPNRIGWNDEDFSKSSFTESIYS